MKVSELRITTQTFVMTPGLITGTGKTMTMAMPGLLPTDVTYCTVSSGGLSLGTSLTGSKCVDPDTLTLDFTTTIGLGVTLGSLTFELITFRKKT